MDSIVIPLIAAAAVLLLGALGDLLFQRTGIPDLLFLMTAGLLLGPVLELVPRSELDVITPHVATAALVYAVLEAGSRLELTGDARPSGRGAALGAMAFLTTLALIIPVAMIAALAELLDPSFGFGMSLLVAAALGSAASAVAVKAIGKARIDASTQRLLESDSAVGGALAIVVVAVVIDVLTASGDGPGALLLSLLHAVPVGIAMGMIAAIAWILFLRAVRSSEHSFALTLAAALIVFALLRLAHADALLGVFSFAVVMANADAISVRLRLGRSPFPATDGAAIRSGLALVIRASLFVTAGMWMAPPWAALGLGLLLAGVIFGGRVPAVLVATRGQRTDTAIRWLLALTIPRGPLAAALLLAPIAIAMPGGATGASVGGSTLFATVVVFVAGVLVLQTVRKGALLADGLDDNTSQVAVSVVDSTARPAMEVTQSVVAAPAGTDAAWEAGSGPPTARVPTPLPLPEPPARRPLPPPPRLADREIRATMPSAPTLDENEVQEATETPRRLPVPGAQGGDGGSGTVT